MKKITNKKNSKLKMSYYVAIMILVLLVITALFTEKIKNSGQKLTKTLTAEELRSMTYNQVQQGEEIVSGTDENVRFDAFFLRDLDEDGVAETIRGNCQEIGKDNKLYMELNVLTEGYLKEGTITIDGKNFYLATELPKDEQIKNNYIGANTQKIELKRIDAGTQKIIYGIVRSGDYKHASTLNSAIGNNINNYSRNDNNIILTGIYVNGQNEEIEIRKEVPLTIDWHGKVEANIINTSKLYEDLDNRINLEDGTIVLDVSVNTREELRLLKISKNCLEGTIPKLNGYNPISVTTTLLGVDFTYDESTRKFQIMKIAETDENGDITKSISTDNSYGIKILYPLEAFYTLGEEKVTIQIPVNTYFEGYNNPNPEFRNPYRSNIASTTITATYKKYVR